MRIIIYTFKRKYLFMKNIIVKSKYDKVATKKFRKKNEYLFVNQLYVKCDRT